MATVNNAINNTCAAGITVSGGAVSINSGTSVYNLSTDASATTVAIATGGAVKGVTLGSVNSTSATTVQSGSGALLLTATNGAITANSGTGTISVSSDSTNNTVNLATGAGNKVVTLGSTSGSSSLALKFGTADFSMASATGTLMSILDTGEITTPLQPTFAAYLSASTSDDKTGDGTVYQVICDTEIVDLNADYNNGTGVFTAPVTGRYLLMFTGLARNIGVQTTGQNRITTTARNWEGNYMSPVAAKASGNFLGLNVVAIEAMTAGDTAVADVIYSGSTKTVGVLGAVSMFTVFMGQLIA